MIPTAALLDRLLEKLVPDQKSTSDALSRHVSVKEARRALLDLLDDLRAGERL